MHDIKEIKAILLLNIYSALLFSLNTISYTKRWVVTLDILVKNIKKLKRSGIPE